jgi:predicted RNase H-like nuclease (RuvC/YqgF family)
MEKTQLQAPVNDLSKTIYGIQTQNEDLNRMNREKTGKITSLQNKLDAVQAKAMKTMAFKVPAKSPTKPAAK